MRILIWAGTFWPALGGVPVYLERLLPALRARGHEIAVVAFASQDSATVPYETQYRGIAVFRFPVWKTHNHIAAMVRMREEISALCRSFAPDIVHKNYAGMGEFFFDPSSTAQAAILLVLHRDWHENDTTLARRVLSRADWVVGVSQTILERSRDLAPEITPRSSVIHNALDEPDLRPTPLPFSPPRLLCIGRLVQDKGFDLVFGALPVLLARFPGLTLTVTGEGSDREILQRQATALGIAGSVHFSGQINLEEVAALINNATAVIMPSRRESFGLVALETAIMGRPIIAARVGGIPEIVSDQQTGILIDPESSNAITAAVTNLLENAEKAQQMGTRARNLAKMRFSFARHVDAYDRLYKTLLDANVTREPHNKITSA